jgi:hypothetical protein
MEGFTILEVLQTWIDLIASSIHPSQVRLLGINGGDVSALDYRIALALGAYVAVIDESGREAARLFQDADWRDARNLIRLAPDDVMTTRAFLASAAPQRPEAVGPATKWMFMGYGTMPRLPKAVREAIARALHKAYQERRAQEGATPADDEAMVDWEELDEGLKQSNLEQADSIVEKLRQIGCDVRELGEGEQAEQIEFSDTQIEFMAEMEHARYNTERLSKGWVWGERRDTKRKVNPNLASWQALSERIKDYDREPVREIPKLLGDAGIEIVPAATNQGPDAAADTDPQ